jgi:hypothetical protein
MPLGGIGGTAAGLIATEEAKTPLPHIPLQPHHYYHTHPNNYIHFKYHAPPHHTVTISHHLNRHLHSDTYIKILAGFHNNLHI